MGDVLAESIQSLPEAPESELNRINLLWSLVVGEEIANRSRVLLVVKDTLIVEVRGKEWVPVVLTYEWKILAKLNKIVDSKGFTEIIVKQGEGLPIQTNKPLKISAPTRHTEPMDKHTVDREEHLQTISDPELRERLASLASKLRFVSLAWVSLFILANCASVPSSQVMVTVVGL